MLRATILGCGSSGGVPRIGGHWGKCDPAEPKNRRRRCSLLVERLEEGKPEKATRILVDTPPDMRDQLIEAGVGWLDGVLFTHYHADQTHGIDDLRSPAINRMRRVDVYMDAATADNLRRRFDYCFETPAGLSYPPILNDHRITAGRAVVIEGEGGPISALPFIQGHGDVDSLGFRFGLPGEPGPLAYSSDLVSLPEASFACLEGLECWIVDALRRAPHPSHAHLALTLEWIMRLRPRRAVLTNMHLDLDYRTLLAELPESVRPGYDGMILSFPGA